MSIITLGAAFGPGSLRRGDYLHLRGADGLPFEVRVIRQSATTLTARTPDPIRAGEWILARVESWLVWPIGSVVTRFILARRQLKR